MKTLQVKSLPLTCMHATSLFDRMRGLLGQKSIPENKGMLIEPCKQVHTLFMSCAIDALFLNHDNEILAIETLSPWKISGFYRRASKVLELAESQAQNLGLKPGQRLEFLPC